MIPKECKRLAEVDFPIAVVSKHSAREKSIRHGHPSTLHLWWARRPLAACRAILLGLLLPDPSDPRCPKDFKDKAREFLPKVQGKPGQNDEDLQKALLKFIGDFSNWDLSTDQTYLEVSRGLVNAAHPEETPLVVDPFAGGGSIPLEALRLGCEVFASDLNPVACLILKVMLEDIPRHGPELADELRGVGKEIKEAAEKELKDFYPDDPDGSKPIAYLWARTVMCEAPNCGAEIPLVKSFWLCKKPKRKQALRYKVIREERAVDFEVFEPQDDNEVPKGTVAQAKATCLSCGMVVSPDRLRAQLISQEGGADVIFDERGNRIGGARLMTVVTLNQDEKKRQYRLPTGEDYAAVWMAVRQLPKMTSQAGPDNLPPVPNETFHNIRPSPNARGLSAVTRYGINRFSQLFVRRQLLSILTFCKGIHVRSSLASSTNTLLGLIFSRVADYCSAQSRWDPSQERNVNSFGRQALPMLWDFSELVPFRDCVGAWTSMQKSVIRVIKEFQNIDPTTGVENADATEHPLSDSSAHLWFTDPPYYDSIPYADLSDFFYVWLKRVLPDETLLLNRFEPENPLTPKVRECVWNRAYKFNGEEKTPAFFENCVGNAFSEGRRITQENGIACVVFAHKTTEGWEALLSALIRSGWIVVGSWPIATEQAQRLVARDSSALATSVHLICRPRTGEMVGDWGDVLQELPKRVGDWMERMQSEGIRGADLVFACIGPALEIYSRYSKVVDAEEREIPLGGDPEASEPHRRGFLSYVWEVVGRTALEQVLGTTEARARNSTAGALEEDARLTALFLWTLQSTNGNGAREKEKKDEDIEEDEEEEETPKKKKQGYSLIFDVVRRFAQPLGIHLPEWEGRVIETEKGVVRLLSVKERGKQLFGEESISVAGFRIEEQARRDPQMKFDFAVRSEGAIAPEIKARRPKKKKELTPESSPKAGVTTTLDRVHAAMLLQSSGQTNALRALLKAEQERGPDFLRLSNALSALYPKTSEEKRLLDAMLLAMPR